MNSKVNKLSWYLIAMLLLIVALAACTATPATETAPTPSADVDVAQLSSSVWQLARYTNRQGEVVPILAGTEITAVFGEDGSLVGSSGCNTYTGNYVVEGQAIAIGSVSATEKICDAPEGIMDQESIYITALAIALSWKVEGNQLELIDDMGNPILSYLAAEDTADATMETETPSAFAVETLANATYLSEWTQSGEVTLTDGEYREPAAPGSATETVVLLTEHIVTMQLDDGQPAATTILVTDPGGSGTFYDLHVLIVADGVLSDIATALLGDRVQINSLSVNENGVIAVDMITQGPDDPLCCPTQRVLQTYVVQRGELVEGSKTILETDQ